jgi:hypothetical protein
MRTAATLFVAAAAALALGALAACGNGDNTTLPGPSDASHDSPVVNDAGGDAKPSGDAGEGGTGEGGAGCGSDKAGTARAPFTCCVMGLIDNHTNGTDTPDPAFCNGLSDDPNDPAQFDKYFP